VFFFGPCLVAALEHALSAHGSPLTKGIIVAMQAGRYPRCKQLESDPQSGWFSGAAGSGGEGGEYE